MNFDRSSLFLYAVTEPAASLDRPLEALVEEALAAGVTLLQLREKFLDEDTFLREALRIRRITERYGVPLIINDNLSVALNCGADGLHIGQNDMPAAQARALLGPGRILGVTAKTVSQALQAERDGADYLGCGAMFPSPTKKDAIPMSRATLTEICKSVSLPVAAIGGITAANISSLAGTGISGAAVVSAIFGSPDIGQAVRSLRRELDSVVADQPRCRESDSAAADQTRRRESSSAADDQTRRRESGSAITAAPAKGSGGSGKEEP